ncbi:MAG: peptidase [Myxococcales bacterium]|nr:peptidase [Myxococcales bacterium]
MRTSPVSLYLSRFAGVAAATCLALAMIAAAAARPRAAQAPASASTKPDAALATEAQALLDLANSLHVGLTRVQFEAEWAASTDVGDRNEGRRTAAGQMGAVVRGDPVLIQRVKALLAAKAKLSDSHQRQLEALLLRAAEAPGTLPAVVSARVETESRQASIQDGFSYCLAPPGKDGKCAKPAIANDIDKVLHESKDMAERRAVWEASKEIGRPLKPGLVALQKLRNQVAREMGYSSFFGLQVASYGMTVSEMMTLLDGFVRDTRPLFKALHTWTARELAKRYSQPLPPIDPKTGVRLLPAHWLPNRWAQAWPGLVTAADLAPYFKGRKPEWITQQAEAFYVSMGFPKLPPTFWSKSDLFPVPAGQPRKKNSHASAWHMDIADDVRSLMSIEADDGWFSTAHHELGHIYYFLAYSRPEVPPLLREGANRAFHEGIGELISVASGQLPYLRAQNIVPADAKIDPMAALLDEALSHTVVFLPWSAGVMSRFEHDLYEKDLPSDQWQTRWWELAATLQHVAPPDPARLTDTSACDACTKTHINDDPAQYYDYAIATVLKYQLHEHIATKLLKQDPRACNYFGSKEAGAFLQGILRQGATRDWRVVLQEATGEGLSTRALMAYFAPLQTWLEAENARALAR